jgi:DNA mismatch repair protein MutS2
MANSSARVLEFESLRDLVRGYAVSDLGRARVLALLPSVDLVWIENQHRLTCEIREFRRVGGGFEFAGLIDVSRLLDKSHIAGAALDTLEIRDVLAIIERAAEWRAIANNPPQGMKAEWSAVRELSSGVADFNDLLRGLRNKILPDGTLDDKASPQLASIRREIEKQRRSIQQALQSFLRRLSEGGAAQDEVVTVRGERFVIPVKAEHKRRVQGVVHGASSSGQTVFVEPLETIEQNNELVRLLEDELAEVHRILLEMTSKIGERASEILTAVAALAELELQFAKAKFAEDYDCVAPVFNDKVQSITSDYAPTGVLARPQSFTSHLILHDARHPLLEKNLKSKTRSSLQEREKDRAPSAATVVPISIELEGDRRELIITGPNTGGKTVGLKTAGLLALMAQSWPISATINRSNRISRLFQRTSPTSIGFRELQLRGR